MLKCGSCKTEDPKDFDDETANYCVACEEVSQEIADEEAAADAS